MKLLGFDFEIQYKPRLTNKAANPLSRIPEAAELNVTTTPSINDVDVIQQEVLNDLELVKALEADPLMVSKFTLKQDKLFYKHMLVLSRTSSLLLTILHTFHASVIGGHSEFLHIYKRLTSELY